MSEQKLKQLIAQNQLTLADARELLNMLASNQDVTGQQTIDRLPDQTTIFASLDNTSERSIESYDALPLQATAADFHQRYTLLKRIGSGGMGAVYQVHDHILKRTLAMKCLHQHLIQNTLIKSHFLTEARLIARLQHPNIIPIYDVGYLPEGGLYYTMLEVQGSPLSEVIKLAHQTQGFHDWQPTNTSHWNLFRLISLFLQICEAIAFAHQHQVIHRDLKPENIMTGSFGEVYVMDWGIAQTLATMATEDTQGNQQIAGTPAYMSPEQAQGILQNIDKRSDIYSLGAILHEILLGKAPYSGNHAQDILNLLNQGSPPLIQSYAEQQQTNTNHRLQLPTTLIEACQTCLARSPEARFQDVSDLTLIIRQWLDGTQKRHTAMQLVENALAHDERIEFIKQSIQKLQDESQQDLKGIPSWESENKKISGWSKQDNALSLQDQVHVLLLTKEQLLQAALTHKSDLPEAHAALAAHYHQLHQQATTDTAKTAAQIKLNQHAISLPEEHPDQIFHLTYLQGKGALSLDTQPSGAAVWLEEYVTIDRKLVAANRTYIGQTPIHKHSLAMGSYRLSLQKPGYAPVLYPFTLGRLEHWDSLPPDNRSPLIALPPQGVLGPEDCYVPQGWFVSGGDNQLPTSLPKRRIWMDAFIIRRFPVRHREYLHFLNDLLHNQQEQRAHRFTPRERSSKTADASPLYHRQNESNDFYLAATPPHQSLEHPVCLIDWHSACAYSEWYTQKTATPWRLPHEMEWEKAARGTDGRCFPWGNFVDPSWACMRESHPEERTAHPVDSFPIDNSPYEVRGMGGNIIDWTATPYQRSGPNVTNDRITLHEKRSNENTEMVYKGGSWYFGDRFLRAADRHSIDANHRGNLMGFRIAYTPSFAEE